MGAFASGLASGVASGITQKKAKDKADKTNLDKFKTSADSSGNDQKDETPRALPDEFKHGGKVKRGGRAKVHKGERVLTKRQAKRYGRK